MICTVELGPTVAESELSMLTVSAVISRDRTPLTLTSQSMSGTTFTFGATVNSFSEGDIGNYSCIATVRPQPSTFLTGTGELQSSPFEISK